MKLSTSVICFSDTPHSQYSYVMYQSPHSQYSYVYSYVMYQSPHSQYSYVYSYVMYQSPHSQYSYVMYQSTWFESRICFLGSRLQAVTHEGVTLKTPYFFFFLRRGQFQLVRFPEHSGQDQRTAQNAHFGETHNEQSKFLKTLSRKLT
jgi:hypothetical protein